MMIHVFVNKLKKKLISLHKSIMEVLINKKQDNLQVKLASLIFLVAYPSLGVYLSNTCRDVFVLHDIQQYELQCINPIKRPPNMCGELAVQ